MVPRCRGTRDRTNLLSLRVFTLPSRVKRIISVGSVKLTGSPLVVVREVAEIKAARGYRAHVIGKTRRDFFSPCHRCYPFARMRGGCYRLYSLRGCLRPNGERYITQSESLRAIT